MNMKRTYFIISACLLAIIICSCNRENEPKVIRNAVKDYDGNSYDAVRIGSQVWMKSNLRTTHYADGTPIAPSISQLNHTPGYYEVPGSDVSTCGLFYNWYATVRDTTATGQVQGVCPKGWHVPNDQDWQTLIYYASSHYGNIHYNDNCAARSLASDVGWEFAPTVNEDSLHHVYDSLCANDPNWDPNIPWEESWEYAYCQELVETHQYCPGADPSKNNNTQFTAIPVGGNYVGTESLVDFGRYCFFWSSVHSDYWEGAAHCMGLYTGSPSAYLYDDDFYGGRDRGFGCSVRCIRD